MTADKADKDWALTNGRNDATAAQTHETNKSVAMMMKKAVGVCERYDAVCSAWGKGRMSPKTFQMKYFHFCFARRAYGLLRFPP